MHPFFSLSLSLNLILCVLNGWLFDFYFGIAFLLRVVCITFTFLNDRVSMWLMQCYHRHYAPTIKKNVRYIEGMLKSLQSSSSSFSCAMQVCKLYGLKLRKISYLKRYNFIFLFYKLLKLVFSRTHSRSLDSLAHYLYFNFSVFFFLCLLHSVVFFLMRAQFHFHFNWVNIQHTIFLTI